MKDQSLFTAAHYNNSSSTSLGVWALREQHTIAIILHTVVPHNQPLLSPFSVANATAAAVERAVQRGCQL